MIRRVQTKSVLSEKQHINATNVRVGSRVRPDVIGVRLWGIFDVGRGLTDVLAPHAISVPNVVVSLIQTILLCKEKELRKLLQAVGSKLRNFSSRKEKD